MEVTQPQHRSWLILLAATVTFISAAPCPAGWRQRGRWCYLADTTSTMSWAGARARCQERGGALVSTENRAKLLDVADLLRGNSVTQWWVGIQKTRETSAEAPGYYDNFGDDKVSVSSNSPNSYQCVYLSTLDTFWYWASCDTVMHYVCQRQAERVSVQVVTPDRHRPSASWFATHARNLEDDLYTRRVNSAMDDDKGVFVPERVTLTQPPSPTTSRTTPPMAATVAMVTMVTVAATPAPTTAVDLCQSETWLALDGACYQLELDAKNWTMATEVCAQRGGHLASFSSQDVQQTFVSRLGQLSGSVWLGLRRQSAAGHLTWEDGTRPAYTAWADGQPDFGPRPDGCGALTLHTGEWSIEDCAAYKPFVCQRAVGATSRPTIRTTPVPVTPSRCGGDGWWEYGDSCYLLVTRAPPVSWHAAQRACRRRSANLAAIRSSAENANVFHRATRSNLPVWIGLSRFAPPHQFHWTDGARPKYTAWEHGHDSIKDMASCARMDNEHGSWRAVSCNSPQYYVCQRPADGGAPPPPLPPPPPPADPVCPLGWSPYGADRCLLVYDQLLSWAGARRMCRSQAADADLITIGSSVQQAFVTAAVKNSLVSMWIGLTYAKVENRFLTWTDESPVNYTNWAPGQPSSVCDDCPDTCGLLGSGRSLSPGAWSDVDCSHAFGFICQRPAVSNSSEPAPTGGLGTATDPSCPPPFADFLAVGDACLKVLSRPATWSEAAASCQAENSSLAYVRDVFDNAELVKLLYKDKDELYWLALSDKARYGHPEWSEPWPAEPTFNAWEPGRPAAAHASCAALLPATGLWRHLDCGERRRAVCMVAPRRQRDRAAAARCPSRRWSASQRRCYVLRESVRHSRTWDEARQACQAQGYELAVVSSEDDFLAVMEAVNGLSLSYSAWIGLRQTTNESFQWVDGTPDSFDGWARGEPSQLRETCVEASKLHAGRWNDVRCTMYRPYVCMAEIAGDSVAPLPPSASRQSDGGGGGGGGGGAAGWSVFGIVCLAVIAIAAPVCAAMWLVRRRRRRNLHRMLSGDSRGPDHSVENPAYDQAGAPLVASLSGEGEDGLDGAATARWSVLDQQEEHPL